MCVSIITVVFVLLQSLSLYALVGDQLMVVARSIGSNQYQVMALVLFIQQKECMMMSFLLMSNYAVVDGFTLLVVHVAELVRAS